MTATRESRPSMAETAPTMRLAAHPQDTGAPRVPHLSADERINALPAYCLLVKSPSERVTRRLFLSLPAAMRATERAQQRGSSVHLELCHIVPVSPDVTAGGEPR